MCYSIDPDFKLNLSQDEHVRSDLWGCGLFDIIIIPLGALMMLRMIRKVKHG
jgi:hypothetical protein